MVRSEAISGFHIIRINKNFLKLSIICPSCLRDRPFILKGEGGMAFCFVQKFFFRTTQELEYFFFCRAKLEIFFQTLTLGYMTKTLNQIIFFFLHQNQNIFFSNIGNHNIFLEKNHNPPLQVKWLFP